MSPKLHLYMCSGSCAMASHIALQESGLEYTTTEIQARRAFPAEYLHLNPKGRVPILDFDGELITEGLAIVHTISALVPSKNLLGKTLLENARANEWLSYLTGTLHGQAFAMLFKPQRFVDEESMLAAVKAKGAVIVKDCFKYVDEKLDGRLHAVGDAFTVVDAYLLVFWRWGAMMKFDMHTLYPNYFRVVQNVLEREAVRIVLAAEGIAPMEG